MVSLCRAATLVAVASSMQPLTRRDALVSVPAASAALAPRRIVSTVGYDDLVQMARRGEIATVQIAPQHDYVFATLRNDSSRVACALPDRLFPHLVADSMDANGLPYEVLPLDSTRAAVRDGFQTVVALGGALVSLEFAGVRLGLRELFARMKPPPSGAADDEDDDGAP